MLQICWLVFVHAGACKDAVPVCPLPSFQCTIAHIALHTAGLPQSNMCLAVAGAPALASASRVSCYLPQQAQLLSRTYLRFVTELVALRSATKAGLPLTLLASYLSQRQPQKITIMPDWLQCAAAVQRAQPQPAPPPPALPARAAGFAAGLPAAARPPPPPGTAPAATPAAPCLPSCALHSRQSMPSHPVAQSVRCQRSSGTSSLPIRALRSAHQGRPTLLCNCGGCCHSPKSADGCWMALVALDLKVCGLEGGLAAPAECLSSAQVAVKAGAEWNQRDSGP